MKPLTSCCCFNLRTGGLILGWLSLIGGVLGFVKVLVVASKAKEPVFVVIIIIVASVILFVPYLMMEVFWIVGIKKNKEGMMMPSLIFSIILCGIMVMGAAVVIIQFYLGIVSILTSSYGRKGFHITMALISLVICSLLAVLVTYLTAVKYYLYKEIKEHNQRRTTTNLIPDDENGLVYKVMA